MAVVMEEDAANLPDEGDMSRFCAARREVLDRSDLIRFVLSPDGIVVPDLAEKLPGRGVWVGAWRGRVEEAIKRKVFARGFRGPATVEPGLAEAVEHGLRQRALQTLSLVRKAGALVTGFQKLEAAIGAGEVFALVHADDAGADGVRKLDRRLVAVTTANDRTAPATIVCFTREELGLAIGAANVVHAGVRESGIVRKFLRETDRLCRYAADSDLLIPETHETTTD